MQLHFIRRASPLASYVLAQHASSSFRVDAYGSPKLSGRKKHTVRAKSSQSKSVDFSLGGNTAADLQKAREEEPHTASGPKKSRALDGSLTGLLQKRLLVRRCAHFVKISVLVTLHSEETKARLHPQMEWWAIGQPTVRPVLGLVVAASDIFGKVTPIGYTFRPLFDGE
eukprot:scaffold304_cov248-Pinguiococcus_pyrenoidosus.AAC.29